MKTNADHFDLAILGGGAAAFAAALKAEGLKAKTLLINTGLPLGGTCVNVGCIPSKHLLHLGQISWQARHHPWRSLSFEKPAFDFATAIKDKDELVKNLRRQKYEEVLAGLKNVQHLSGQARFVGPHEIEVIGSRSASDGTLTSDLARASEGVRDCPRSEPQAVASGQRYRAEKFLRRAKRDNKVLERSERFLIATGSTAVAPPIPGLKEAGFLTHITAMEKRPGPFGRGLRPGAK